MSTLKEGTMMKKLKGAALLICASAMLCLNGCGKSDQELVLDYLTEKYGESFVVLDSESSSDGRSPFSYSYTAYCAPADHPEYLFRTIAEGLGSDERNSFRDYYGTGILNVRIAGMLKENLDLFFGEVFVTADLNRTGSQILPDMENIEYFTFLGITPEQASDGQTNIDFFVAVSNATYQAESFTAEYDALLGAVSELSGALHARSDVTVLFMEEAAYQAFAEWNKKTLHPFPFRDYANAYQSVRLTYDPADGKVVPGFNRQEPMTAETYAQKRQESQNMTGST